MVGACDSPAPCYCRGRGRRGSARVEPTQGLRAGPRMCLEPGEMLNLFFRIKCLSFAPGMCFLSSYFIGGGREQPHCDLRWGSPNSEGRR